MKLFFHLITLIFITLISTTLSASNPADWETYFENDSIKIEYTYMNCIYTEQFDSEFVILKISNYTNDNITIEWKEELWYENNCINCESNSTEHNKQITISGNAFSKGDCIKQSHLRIFSKFTEELSKMNGVEEIISLTNFQLININIKKDE